MSYLQFPEIYGSFEVGDINNLGEIVGTAGLRGMTDDRALKWRSGGNLFALPALRWNVATTPAGDGRFVRAFSINNLGEVAGQANSELDGQRATRWPDDRTVDDLLAQNSSARSINDAGVIVGTFSVGWLSDNGFRWESGQWLSLYPPMIVARSINNLGQIVGYDGTDAYVWDRGEFTTLASLGGKDRPYDLNDVGQIVGYAGEDGVNNALPVVWQNGTIRQLPYFGLGGWGTSINNNGEATGVSFPENAHALAVVWRNNLVMNLNDLVMEPLGGDWEVFGASAINSNGQIAASLSSVSLHRSIPVRLEPVDIGLTLWGIDPSRPGRRNTIEIHHVSPNGRVILLWGTTRGEPQPFQQCSGAMIDLADPHLAAFGVADSNGVARITLNVPANVEGNYIFQAVDHTTCEVSPPAWALFKMVN